jgi:hypothetical protein
MKRFIDIVKMAALPNFARDSLIVPRKISADNGFCRDSAPLPKSRRVSVLQLAD